MRPEFGTRVALEATLALSEDPEKVVTAIKNILGDATHTVARTERLIHAESSDPRSLDRIHDQLRDRQVRAAARKRFLAGTSGRRTTVMVNRQAATAGVIVLCDNEEESPLGPIYLTVESERLDSVIQWLTDYPSG